MLIVIMLNVVFWGMLIVIMLIVIALNVTMPSCWEILMAIMLIVIILNVLMPSVVAPSVKPSS